ncbi:hypothetical protein BpHYR1_002347 [Brachionus plicatilis]|uniref:Uncharacterized protein n=1 Tax=Brachionus plicatilis TaxID=10195 RepID=A0A3M7Q1Z6_BRAPC|nr:hypothetical protein BpHYR1_002347 [Brachionus plicatilis]
MRLIQFVSLSDSGTVQCDIKLKSLQIENHFSPKFTNLKKEKINLKLSCSKYPLFSGIQKTIKPLPIVTGLI